MFKPVSRALCARIAPRGFTKAVVLALVLWGAASGYASAVLLYSQTNDAGANSTLSANFDDFPTFSSQLADDFTVPAGQTWTITQVFAGGVYFNGSGPASTVDVVFYADNGTIPGSAVATFTGAPFLDSSGNFTITIPGSLPLGPGSYWVSVVANMNFGNAGEWGWTDRTVQAGDPAAWQNPGGGFGIGCTTWTAKTTCITIASGPDQIFSITGTIGIVNGAPEPATLALLGIGLAGLGFSRRGRSR